MKLLTKLFIVTDAKGKDINVKGMPIVLAMNGEKTTTKLQDVFSGPEYDLGEVYGNSLLSHYQVMEDGSLEVEGSKIQFMNADTDELILVKNIEKPFVRNDGSISFEDVKAFSEYFKISKPDEVFSSLSQEEKETFSTQRQAAETASKAAEEATVANTAKEKAAAQEAAEATLKASIDPAYVQDMNAYHSTQSFYAALDGFKQYIKEPYHLFYGDDPNQSLCILIDRGATWKEEVKEENYEILSKTDKAVVIQFLDGTAKKNLTLDLESGQIEITDPRTEE